MKLHFLFITREEIKHSEIWQSYFENNDNYSISIYTNPNYSLINNFFKQFQINHSIHKNREYNVEIKYNCLKQNYNNADYFIFLTEDSLPIKNIKLLKDKLSNLTDKSIFAHQKDPHVNINDGRIRYGEIRNFNFPTELRYKNDDWVCLCNKHANLLVNNKEDCHSFIAHIGGEHFISSILNKHNELHNVINQQFVFENWDSSHGLNSFTGKDQDKLQLILNNEFTFFLRKYESDFLELYHKMIKIT